MACMQKYVRFLKFFDFIWGLFSAFLYLGVSKTLENEDLRRVFVFVRITKTKTPIWKLRLLSNFTNMRLPYSSHLWPRVCFVPIKYSGILVWLNKYTKLVLFTLLIDVRGFIFGINVKTLNDYADKILLVKNQILVRSDNYYKNYHDYYYNYYKMAFERLQIWGETHADYPDPRLLCLILHTCTRHCNQWLNTISIGLYRTDAWEQEKKIFRNFQVVSIF